MGTRIIAAAVGLLAALVLPAAPAAAAEERLACAVATSGYLATDSYCYNDRAPSNTGYVVVFDLRDEPADSTGFGWSVVTLEGTPLGTVFSGCGSVDTGCSYRLPRTAEGRYRGTVTYTAGGVARTFEATAQVNRYCGSELC